MLIPTHILDNRVVARFDLPYRLFEFVAALRALESDRMRINTCHRRMPPSRLRDQGTQRKEKATPDRWRGERRGVGERQATGSPQSQWLLQGSLAGSLNPTELHWFH